LENLGSCTRPADEHDIKRLESPDRVLQSQKRTFHWLKGVRELAEEDEFPITTINSVFDYVRRFPHRDSDVCDLLNESEYLETWKEDAAAHSYRYNPVGMLMIRTVQPGDFRNEVTSLFDCAGRYGDELMKLNQIKGGLETINAIAELYSNMLQDIRRRADRLVMSQPGVGPLATLSSICGHLLGDTYSQHYSLPVSSETSELRIEWEQQTGMRAQGAEPSGGV